MKFGYISIHYSEMKCFMKRLIAIGTVLCALLLLSSCDNNARLQEGSSITVIEIGRTFTGINLTDPVIFSGDHIQWFNATTREIRFRDNYAIERIPQQGTLLFKLSNHDLFIARIVQGDQDIEHEDLVLYHDTDLDRFYLYNSYPKSLNTESVRINEEIRQENWSIFIFQLRTEGCLK